MQYICKCNQKGMCSARTQINIRVTSSAVIFISEKSVQGRHKLIQFRFISNRRRKIYIPIYIHYKEISTYIYTTKKFLA